MNNSLIYKNTSDYTGSSKEVEALLSLILCLGLLSSVTLPMIPVGSLGVYLTVLISPIMLVATFICFSLKPKINKSINYIALMGIMVILSAIVSWATEISPINERDIIESIKYFQFLPYLMAIPFISSIGLNTIKKSIIFASFIFLLFGFFQAISPTGIVYNISTLYLGDGSEHLNYLDRRITITGSNPNTGSVIACFFCIFYFSLYSQTRRFIFILASICFFYLSFATQSRTGLIAIIAAISCYYLLFHKTNTTIKISLILSGVSAIVFLVFYLDLSYIYIGIEQALEGKNNSLNIRLEKFETATGHFLDHPVTGIGPAKSSQSTIIDSEYALIIQRYGLFGIIATLAYIFYLFRLSITCIDSHWGATLFTFTLFIVITMLTNNVFAGYQLMSLIIISHISCIVYKKKYFSDQLSTKQGI